MSATLLQLLQAYSVFNNDGKRVTPTLIDSLYAKEEKPFYFAWPTKASVEVISKETAQTMHEMLVSNVHKVLVSALSWDCVQKIYLLLQLHLLKIFSELYLSL